MYKFEKDYFMNIASIRKSYFYYPKKSIHNKEALVSAPQISGADIFSFKGKALSEKIGIIPSADRTNLEKNIEEKLGVIPANTEIKRFKNGEIYVSIQDRVRGKDIYLMPASGGNVNDNLMETYLKADAAKRAGADRVIAVMPNFDYARQEKRSKAGEPIAAKLNMDLLRTSGVDEIITVDLHTPAIEGCASNDLKINHLESVDIMKNYIQQMNIPDLVIVSPDMGGAKRADKLAKALGVDKAIIYKHRQAHNEATAEDLIGDVKGKNCIIYDDIIDTAGTIAEASRMLKRKGAENIYVFASHGLFNGDAVKQLQESPVKEVYVTNSVARKPNCTDKIKQIDISSQIAGTILDISA